MKSSDRQLIRNIRKGDAKSFEELFDRYYDRFYAFACALLHDRDAAEDILQNVFLKLWIGRERLDEDRSVSNYLLVSVRNEIYDWLSLKYNSAIVRCSAPPESEDYSADIEESMAVLETSGRLDRIISSMPPQRQKVFMMSPSTFPSVRSNAISTLPSRTSGTSSPDVSAHTTCHHRYSCP